MSVFLHLTRVISFFFEGLPFGKPWNKDNQEKAQFGIFEHIMLLNNLNYPRFIIIRWKEKQDPER